MDNRCQYLGRGAGGVCEASITKMVPSLFEHNIYCTTKEHYRCPLLIARSMRDGYREAAERAGAVQGR